MHIAMFSKAHAGLRAFTYFFVFFVGLVLLLPVAAEVSPLAAVMCAWLRWISADDVSC